MNEADVRVIYHLTAPTPPTEQVITVTRLSNQPHQLQRYPTIRAQTLFSSHTFNCFPACKMGPQLSLNNFPLSKNISFSSEYCTHCACPLRANLSLWWPRGIRQHLSLPYCTLKVPYSDANFNMDTINWSKIQCYVYFKVSIIPLVVNLFASNEQLRQFIAQKLNKFSIYLHDITTIRIYSIKYSKTFSLGYFFMVFAFLSWTDWYVSDVQGGNNEIMSC